MNCKAKMIAVTLFGMAVSFPVEAQEKTKASVGADLVSGYIWRGNNCGGVSIQPTLSVARSGFSLTAWGSVGFDNDDTKELDLTAAYSAGGLKLGVTDYWFNQTATPDGMQTNKYFEYGTHSTAHIFEGTIGYDFGLLALSWNTNFAGADYTPEGDRTYSTYIEAVAPFRLGGLDFAAEVGFTPWKGLYADKFNVTNIGLKATKDIRITESFMLPVFAKLIVNPYTEGAYFVFGLSL